MIHITCRLTAKNRDQLRKPTLGNRVWAAFFAVQFRSFRREAAASPKHRRSEVREHTDRASAGRPTTLRGEVTGPG